MLANANPEIDASPVSREARKIIAVCAKHGVEYGDLNSLAGFMRALHQDKHLAMNFWSVVARMTEEGGAQTSEPEWLLGAIVEGVTGRKLAEVREAGPAYRVLVSRLAGMLAGEDVPPPAQEDPVKPASAAKAIPEADMAAMRDRRAAMMADAVEAPLAPRIVEERIDQPATPPAGSPLIAESPLVQRAVPARASRRGGPVPIAPVTNPAWTSDQKLRLVLDPEPVATAASSAEEHPIFIPLSGYEEETSRPALLSGWVVGGVLAFVILATAGWWIAHSPSSEGFTRLGDSIRVGYDSALAAWNGTTAPPAQTPAPSPASVTPPSTRNTGVSNPPAAKQQPRNSGYATQNPAAGRSAARDSMDQAAVAANSSRDQRPDQAEGIPADASPTPQPSSRATEPRLSPASEPRELAPTQRASSANESHANSDAEVAATSAGQVVVPESIMKNNLVSSRVPVYPEVARDQNIGGRVVLQAIVNKDGTVGHLHVLQGPSELRRAALEAVSTWRYRPYLVNGQPMDVETRVSIDFNNLQ